MLISAGSRLFWKSAVVSRENFLPRYWQSINVTANNKGSQEQFKHHIKKEVGHVSHSFQSKAGGFGQGHF